MDTRRLQHLVKFYEILDQLEKTTGEARKLVDCHGRMAWPKRGVYFFREAGENRSDSGVGPRIVRIGTHALKRGGATTLWSRLSGHKGHTNGGGNHRGSIFRLIVGTALIGRDRLECSTWDVGNSAGREIRALELKMEKAVSEVVRSMPFLYVAIEDEPGPDSMRGRIERNSIALLSNFDRSPLDPPSSGWLGHHCDRDRVKASGLWNQNHVDENYDPAFLDDLEHLAQNMERAS
jgi:hypothetical protein